MTSDRRAKALPKRAARASCAARRDLRVKLLGAPTGVGWAEPDALRRALTMLGRTRHIAFESWASDGGETVDVLRASGFSIAPLDSRNFLASGSSRGA